MAHRHFARPLAMTVALTLTLTSAASALTPEQAGQLLTDYYIDEVPQSVLKQATVQKMVEALGDPYTQYFTAEEYAQFNSSMEDTNLVGIGVSMLAVQEGLLIQRVYSDTPAADGGLQAGDLIIAVDGKVITKDHLLVAASWIQGEAGTQVSVTYLRDGAEHTVTLTRRAVTLPATYSELLDGHIGYIDCDTFGGDTLDHFLDGLGTYGSQADHWIVDLQDNGGGMVDAAASTAACFTGDELSFYFRDKDKIIYPVTTSVKQQTTAPVIVLTNENTASASELFAAAIRDSNAGLVVGGRTYGKGVAQTVFDQQVLPDYFPDGDALKVTVYRLFSSVGTTTNTIGVFPHLLVDSAIAPAVAFLLSGTSPEDTGNTMRIDFGWKWYVDLDTALSPDYRDAFVALLEALPETASVLEGTGGADGWTATTAAALAQKYGLTEYQPRTFSDIADSPYRQEIQLLATYEVLQGDGSGAFRPTEGLTRAQLCALLAQALHCKEYTGASQFSDVAEDSWYASPVNALAKLGLVNGVGNGQFDPDAPVDHQQFITMMARLGRQLNLSLDLTASSQPENALDAPQLADYADWAKDSVWLLGEVSSLLWDEPEDIVPTAPATREEAAALTSSLLVHTGILPD